MHDHVWWKHLHWPESGAELLGTAFLLFAGVSAVVFDFGTGSPLAHVLLDKSGCLLITGLLFAGSRHFATRKAQRRTYQSGGVVGILGAREDASS
jgi:hypothetical protein